MKLFIVVGYCVLESSSFVEPVEYVDGKAVESVVVTAVDYCRLLCALVLLELLNLLLLKMLIVVCYIMCSSDL